MPMDRVYTNVIRKFQDADFGFLHVDYLLFEPTVAFDIHRFENGVKSPDLPLPNTAQNTISTISNTTFAVLWF